VDEGVFIAQCLGLCSLIDDSRRVGEGSSISRACFHHVVVSNGQFYLIIKFDPASLNSLHMQQCHLVEEPSDLPNADFASEPQSNDGVTLISVQAFTPILATLLLSSNGVVSGSARFAIVELLARIHKADDLGDQDADDPSYGLFGRIERSLFEEEVIQQLVIGMGRLESGEDENDTDDVWYTPAVEVPQPDHPLPSDSSVNPYFPSAQISSSSAISIPATSSIPPSVSALPGPPVGVPPPHEAEFVGVDTSPMAILSLQLGDVSQHSPLQATAEGSWDGDMMSGATTYAGSAHSDLGLEEEGQEMDPGEQAAVGRLSSMSLIAAVVAGGTWMPTSIMIIINFTLILLLQAHRELILNVFSLEKLNELEEILSTGSEERRHSHWVLLQRLFPMSLSSPRL